MGQLHSLFSTAEKATSENIDISQGSEQTIVLDQEPIMAPDWIYDY